MTEKVDGGLLELMTEKSESQIHGPMYMSHHFPFLALDANVIAHGIPNS
jgi:hypothetical protein